MNILEYEIIDHGIDSSDYFQGCGIAHTKFDDVATGIGTSVKEALENAAEDLAVRGYDIPAALAMEIDSADETDLIADTEGDQYYFVSIRIKTETL